MKEYFVKQVSDGELRQELNAFSKQGWNLYKLQCCSANDEAYRFWMIIVERESKEVFND